MAQSPTTHDAAHAAQAGHREKGLVALSSVLAAILLTGTKLAVGLHTGSLGILSEAAHSLLDLVAAAITLWAVRAASRPADREHTYGHGKFENLSALFETVLLLATCVWIVYESIDRLFFENVRVDSSAWAFGIMGLSIVVDVSRSRALLKAARKYQSQALEADALHFSTDVWSSSVVIVGLGLVAVSSRLGLPWLEKADAAAALGVAGIVAWVSFKLGKKSIDDLLDAVPPGMKEQVTRAARVQGVVDVLQVRIRRSGPEFFADVTVGIHQESSFRESHAIASAAEGSIRAVLPGTDVTIHCEPVEAPASDAPSGT